MANHVLQLVFHSFGGFRWPIAFFASATATAHQLYLIIWEAIDLLGEYGFDVSYIMMDGASTNRSLTNMMIQGDLRAANFNITNIYDVTEEITIVQDIKHVFKKIRNGLESSRTANKTGKGRYLLANGSPITWDYWVNAYHYNLEQGGIRVHPRLTKEHIELSTTNKMRNHLATDVLDHNMFYLMKACQASSNEPKVYDAVVTLLGHTAKLVEVFDDPRPIASVEDTRLNDISDSLKFFNDWEANCKNQAKELLTRETRDDLNSSVAGFIQVCQRVIPKGVGVRPKFFNSDLIENFFCQQRGIRNGLNTNPTIAQYGPGINAIVLGQTTVSTHSNSSSKALPFKGTTPVPLNNKQRRPIRL